MVLTKRSEVNATSEVDIFLYRPAKKINKPFVTIRGKKAAVIAIKLDRVQKKCALTERSMIAF